MINLQKEFNHWKYVLRAKVWKKDNDQSRQIAKTNILQKAKVYIWFKQMKSEEY